MALIKCEECGKEYSDKALSCPNCGCPTEDNINQPEEMQRTITPFNKVVGYMRKSIIGYEYVIIIKDLTSVKEINVNDIDEVKYCKATFSSNGFLTICTKDGCGHNVTDALVAKNNENSILFNQPQNKVFEKLAYDITKQLSVEMIQDNLLTAAGAHKKQVKEEAIYQQERIDRMKKDGVVFCPKCHSQSVTYVNKKLSIGRAFAGAVLAGDAGAVLGGQSSKKGTNKCMNCGYTWKI